MESEKNIKGQFMFSPIFESEDDCRDNPFVFEKFDLKTKLPTEYQEIRKAGNLYRLKKD